MAWTIILKNTTINTLESVGNFLPLYKEDEDLIRYAKNRFPDGIKVQNEVSLNGVRLDDNGSIFMLPDDTKHINRYKAIIILELNGLIAIPLI